MKRLPKIAGAGPLADYAVGDRVMTREGIAGVIEDILEGPADLTTYWVTLDGGLGGGEYAEAEIWPETSSTAGRVDASVTHTAVDDYPELGTILSDRLPPQIRTVAGAARTHADDEDYDDDLNHPVRYPGPGSIVGSCPDCGGPIYAGLAHENSAAHREWERTRPWYHRIFSAHDEAAAKIALTFDPTRGADPDPDTEDPEEAQGYKDGFADAKAGTTRNFQDPVSLAYRAGYDRGWGFGIEVSRKPVDTFAEENDLVDQQVAGIDGVVAGFLTDLVKGDDSDPKYDGYRSYDWCRYRRDNHCFYSKNLDEKASEEAGYAVWIPEDRGLCPRRAWEAQQACSMALPGPNVPGGYTNATVPYEQGGQHGGAPTDTYRKAALDPALAFHLTATWRTVQDKAKRIRSEGGVRVVAAKHGTVVGHVRGDTDVYETELVRVPGRKSIGSWACGCRWGSYSWGRSGPWKRFEGRMCSHALALQYEAQARGMFDRAMTLDEKQPSWMKGTEVRTPGSYDRDKQQYTSALRPVYDQSDEKPVTAMVAAMQGEGYRYAEIRAFAHAVGVEDAPGLVREARKTKSFVAKVRGLIVNLFIDDDGTLVNEGTGAAVALRDVVHPNWDPVRGITDYRQPHEGSLGCGCGGACGCGAGMSRTASPADVIGKAKTMDEAATALLTVARSEEPTVTREMQALATAGGGHLAGLEHRLKGKDSLLRKMTAEASQHPSPAACAMGMSDSLRYTMVLPPDAYTATTEKALATLQAKGYSTRTKNYWQRGDAYNGINVALTTPDGFPVELQFHTDESLRVKETQVHPIYEKWRTEPDSNKRAILGAQMRDLYDMVPRPLGALGINTLKKQPTVPWSQIQYFPHAAALDDGWKYLLIDTTGQVLRWSVGAVQVWDNGLWVDSPEHARYPFLGEPNSEEITADQADYLLTGEPSYDADTFAVAGPNGTLAAVLAPEDTDFLPYAYVPEHRLGYSSIEARLNGWPVGKITWERESGKVLLLHLDDDGISPADQAQIKADLIARAQQMDPRVKVATLHDEPEAALPTTDGADEPDEHEIDYLAHAAGAISASLEDDIAAQFAEENPSSTEGCDICGDSGHTTAEHEQHPEILDDANRKGAALVEAMDAFIAGTSDINPFAHLGDPRSSGGSADSEIMRAAQEALSKSALKTYSPAEKKQIIDEGLDVEASNLDRLDIAGTHYEVLEASLGKAATLSAALSDDMWLLDGDPNGG